MKHPVHIHTLYIVIHTLYIPCTYTLLYIHYTYPVHIYTLVYVISSMS